MHWGWRVGLLGLVAVWLALLMVRCHLPRQTVISNDDGEPASAIYVVRHGWHAGVAVPTTELQQGPWPLDEEFPQARYLEIGWGETKYYPGHTRGVWGILRAGFWPTGSVLHVVPVPDSVAGSFEHNTIVRIPVQRAHLTALTKFLAASFTEDTLAASSGYYPGSRFYPSDLTYHGFNNCNHWAAAALEAAGCDTAPRWTFTVGQVVRQAEQCGTLLQRRTSE